MERLIITMPIAPYQKFSVGKMTTPVLAKSLATKLGAKYILAVNILDSYNERQLTDYITLLQQYDIEPDEYWIDLERKEELLERINYLISSGYIHSGKRKILSCNCKKVEISVQNIKTINMIDSCFYVKDNNYYCKHCGGLCEIKEVDSLIFDPSKIQDKDFIFFPEFINKDIKTFYNTVLSNEVIISRERNTGIVVTYNGKSYNIDVDFLWEIYLSLFSYVDKIVICSNHQLYQLFMVSMLEKCFMGSGKTISLATPYLNISDSSMEQELINRNLSLKIFTILNQKWFKKENVFDNGLLNYINSMNVNKKDMLYKILMEPNVTANLLEDLKKALLKDFNLQNANKELKRRRKNV